MANEIVETKAIEQVSDSLYKGVSDIIDNARQEVVVYVNKHSDLMFWHIGHYINEDMGYKQYSAYGSRILATLSQTLTWSHFLELVTIEDNNKRLFYQQMGIAEHWSVRQLLIVIHYIIITFIFCSFRIFFVILHAKTHKKLGL